MMHDVDDDLISRCFIIYLFIYIIALRAIQPLFE